MFSLRNTKMRKTAIVLLLCVIPCLFIIPIFCAPTGLSVSEEAEFCPLLSFTSTSNVLILAESITDFSVPDDNSFLIENIRPLNIPLFSSAIDKPPKV